MLIRYLKLENFLSHENEEITFPAEGMFLLAGDSGIGKSSLIIDATAYALFGPSAVTRAKRKNEMVNELHRDETMKVKAVFQFETGNDLVVERGITPNGQVFAQAYESDGPSSTMLAEGTRPVSKLITSRLGGMNWQQFYAAFVARQHEISMLTSMSGNERKNQIHRMLGMRELEKANDIIAKKLRRDKAEMLQMIKSVGGFDPEQAALEIREIKERIDSEETELDEARKSLEITRGELTGVEREMVSTSDRVEAARERETLVQQLEHLNASRKALDDACRKSAEAQEAVVSLPELKVREVEASEQVNALREAFTRSKKILDRESRLHVPVAVKEPDPAEIKEEIAVLGAMIDQDQKVLVSRQEEIEKLRDGGECYVCQRPFADEHDHKQVIDDLERKISAIDGRIISSSVRKTELQELLPQAEEAAKKQAVLNSEKQMIESMKEEGRWEASLDTLKAEGKTSKDNLDKIQQQVAHLEVIRADVDETAAGKLQQTAARIGEIEKELAENPAGEMNPEDRERVEELTRQVNEMRSSVAALQAKIPEVEKALERSRSDLTRKKELIKGREAEVDSLERVRRKVQTAERVGDYLKGYQKHLASEIRPALEEIGSEMLTTISSGTLTGMHIDESYEITVETSDGIQRRAAMLSGGEQIRANICLRLALTRLVSQRTGVPVGFLIFDEPLPSQDPGHIQKIMSLLESLRPFYQQQFLISHVGDIRSATELDYVIELAHEKPRVSLTNA